MSKVADSRVSSAGACAPLRHDPDRQDNRFTPFKPTTERVLFCRLFGLLRERVRGVVTIEAVLGFPPPRPEAP
jgi:hypothetical protein